VALFEWTLFFAAGFLIVYVAAVFTLVAAGRRNDARALAGFIPDCIVLLSRLIADPRVPRSRKALLALVVAYLATPLDLVPDFIPVAGQLDDAVIFALVLRSVFRASGAEPLSQHWPGPEHSLQVILRFAHGSRKSLVPAAKDPDQRGGYM
jgi:uncharacterized membrane protein YkvA (DUF1232 family)